ncbi:MAG: hypothetical protein IH989_01510 [Planctomycetes bacterium]|nr:hypothetical protein [Planctomycetota bacterium]
MRRYLIGGIVLAAFLQSLTGCSVRYRVAHMIARVDAMPAEERPAEWDRTKALMLREAPKVGEPAPDFTLKRMKSEEVVTLSEYRPDQPKVLIFASYT